uniref:Uncharacterized protein n=1 Tax=Haptolina ericina TaxID=156174 RepID=A0A7S3AGB6_9EUKA
MAALKLPNVGYATNADHGAGCNIHPPPKQYCGARLGDSAASLVYKSATPWRSPTFAYASGVVTGTTAIVTVTLNDVGAAGLTTDVYPYNYLGGSACPSPGYCVWASITLSTGQTLNATVGTSADKRKLLLTAEVPKEASDANVTGHMYAWGAVPLMNAYDLSSGLPVLQWNTAASNFTQMGSEGI